MIQRDKGQAIVFISYAHSPKDNDWETRLAGRLASYQAHGTPQIKVIFDQEEGYAGANVFSRMQTLISEATVIVVVLTPEYRDKAENNFALVGYEYNLIRREIFKSEEPRKKCIPILKSGTLKESMPADLYHLIALDMSTPKAFDGGFSSLLKSIIRLDILNDPQFNNQRSQVSMRALTKRSPPCWPTSTRTNWWR